MRLKDTVVFAVAKKCYRNGNIVKESHTAVGRSRLQPLLSIHVADSGTEHKEISPYFELQHTAVETEKPETRTLYLPT
jgi:hypothetical protein